MFSLKKYRKYYNLLPVVAVLIVIATCFVRIWIQKPGDSLSILNVVALLFAGFCCWAWFWILFLQDIKSFENYKKHAEEEDEKNI